MAEVVKSKKVDELAFIKKVLEKYPCEQASLIAVLQDVQAALKHIPSDGIKQIAKALKVPISHIYAVISFYSCFHLTPQGKHRVDICQGTACHVRGSGMIADQITKELGIKPGQTTPDGELTVNNVNCVGACALGPVAVIDGKYYGDLTLKKLSRAIKERCACKEEETAQETLHQEQTEVPHHRINSPSHLDLFREELLKKEPHHTPHILVCAGTGCIANGAKEVAQKLQEILHEKQVDRPVKLGIKKTGCHGFCEKGPLVVFHPEGTYYTKVKEKDIVEIVEKTVQQPIDVLLISTLMLPSALQVKDVVAALRQRENSTKVIVGGAPFRMDHDLWRRVDADAHGRTATDVMPIIEALLEKGV